MKILLVDDQRAIVESIQKGINWEKVGIDETYIACSAAEAKLILVNFPVDIMLCDIEMPGEDGLSLLQWAKKQQIDVCCIFLTAHAEFAYAKKAIQLGGFDYVLQPAKYAEIEKVVKKACEHVKKEKNVQWMQKTQTELRQNRDIFLSALLYRIGQKEYEEADKAFGQLLQLQKFNGNQTVLYVIRCYYRKQNSKIDKWNTELKLFVTRNVLEELLDNKVQVFIAEESQKSFFAMAVDDQQILDNEKWKQVIERFYHFMQKQMATEAAIYTGCGKGVRDGRLPKELMKGLQELPDNIEGKLDGIHWEEESAAEDTGKKDERIETVMQYVKSHVYENISRADAAGMVFLNEEYFSKLFKAETGMTFKDYVLIEKMKMAGTLLKNTNFSVGVIASKVGFDNFSHFSRTFKKVTDYTPQEYRLHCKNKKEKS